MTKKKTPAAAKRKKPSQKTVAAETKSDEQPRDPRIGLYVRMTPAARKAFRVHCAGEDLRHQKVLEELILDWIEANTDYTRAADPDYPYVGRAFST